MPITRNFSHPKHFLAFLSDLEKITFGKIFLKNELIKSIHCMMAMKEFISFVSNYFSYIIFHEIESDIFTAHCGFVYFVEYQIYLQGYYLFDNEMFV